MATGTTATNGNVLHESNKVLHEKTIVKAIEHAISSLNIFESDHFTFPAIILQHIIEYGRIMVDLHIKSTDNIKMLDNKEGDSECNFNIELGDTRVYEPVIFYPPISDLMEHIPCIQFGIQSAEILSKDVASTKDGASIRTGNPPSLVLEHELSGNIPSLPNSIRYDHDGEVVNYGADLRPRLDGFKFGDIISVEIVFDSKTIEYFKNGQSVLKSKICFDFPWYLALWNQGDCTVRVIQDPDELDELHSCDSAEK